MSDQARSSLAFRTPTIPAQAALREAKGGKEISYRFNDFPIISCVKLAPAVVRTYPPADILAYL